MSAAPAAIVKQARVPGEDDGEETQAPPWGLVYLEDFLAQDFPEPEWLYRDLIQRRTTCVIVAPPNAGKTLEALDIGAEIAAAAIASGLGGTRVVIVEEEGTGGAFQKRLKRAFAAHGGMPRRDAIKVAWNCGRDLANAGDLAQLATACLGADLIILDSLADLSDTDENDPREMKRLGKALRLLQTLTGATIIALHHMTKEAWKRGEMPNLRHLRGHGALAGKVDTVLGLVPGDDEHGFVNFDLYCLKQRDGEKAQPRRVRVCMTGPAATVQMDPLRVQAAAEPSIDDLILAVLPDAGDGMSKAKVAENIGRRPESVGVALDRMAAKGTVRHGSSRYGWIRSSRSSRLFPDVPEAPTSSSGSSRGLYPEERKSRAEDGANAD